MHIQDGNLNDATCVTMAIASATIIAAHLRPAKSQLQACSKPAIGLLGAAIIVCHMADFQIIGGTSGHFLGTAFLAFAFGPSLAMLLMSSILGFQAFALGDGGIASLGANIFNMAIVPCLLSGALIRWQRNSENRFANQSTSLAIASYATIVLASALTGAELVASNALTANEALAQLLSSHAILGLYETSIALVAILLINRVGIRYAQTQQSDNRLSPYHSKPVRLS